MLAPLLFFLNVSNQFNVKMRVVTEKRYLLQYCRQVLGICICLDEFHLLIGSMIGCYFPQRALPYLNVKNREKSYISSKFSEKFFSN